MPLPTNYQPWSHFVSVISQIQNRIIREDFSDTGDDNWDANINTDRASLRVACTIRANDSQPFILLKLILYYIVLRKAQDLQVPYYGMPSGTVQAQRKFKPHVLLYFSQDADQIIRGKDPITGDISWRIMDETSETITRGQIEQIANRIKTHFGSGGGFVWRKGRVMVSYSDWNQGIQFQVLSLNAQEGERVIRQALQAHGASFVPKKMAINENQDPLQKYPATPERETILGESVQLPVSRPVVNVRFRYATLTLHGLRTPIHLYDRGVSLINCVVK